MSEPRAPSSSQSIPVRELVEPEEPIELAHRGELVEREMEPASAAGPTLGTVASAPPFEAQYAAAERAFRRNAQRPLLGPSLVSFGTLLSLYVVFGELVIGLGFPEGLAVVAVLGAFLSTAYASGRQSLAMSPPTPGSEQRRLVLPGLWALGLAVLTVLLVSAFARAGSHSSNPPVVLFFLALGFGTAIYGYHLSGPNLRPAKGAAKAFTIAARILGAILAILVIAQVLASM